MSSNSSTDEDFDTLHIDRRTIEPTSPPGYTETGSNRWGVNPSSTAVQSTTSLEKRKDAKNGSKGQQKVEDIRSIDSTKIRWTPKLAASYLSLPVNSTQKEINNRKKALVLAYHPDKKCPTFPMGSDPIVGSPTNKKECAVAFTKINDAQKKLSMYSRHGKDGQNGGASEDDRKEVLLSPSPSPSPSPSCAIGLAWVRGVGRDSQHASRMAPSTPRLLAARSSRRLRSSPTPSPT